MYEHKVYYKSVEARISLDEDRNLYKVWIPGTDSFRDLLISLNFRRNKDGDHAGVAKIGLGLAHEISREIEIHEWERNDGDYSNYPIEIILGGHSLGGALADYMIDPLAYLLREVSLNVQITKAFLYGAYPCCAGRPEEETKVMRYANGKDPIPFLFEKRYLSYGGYTWRETSNEKPFKGIKDHKKYSTKEFRNA